MNFTTHTSENKHIDFYLNEFESYIKKYFQFDNEIDSIKEYATIDWEFYFEARSWGVKNIGAFATQIKSLIIHVEYYESKDDETIYEREFDLTHMITDFELNSDSENANDFYEPRVITIDFDDKTINVEF
jgi:hypothetical protein